MTGRYRWIVFLLVSGVLTVPADVAVQSQSGNPSRPQGAPGVEVGQEWPVMTGDLAGSRYSKLSQINAKSIKDLRGAWMTKPFESGAASKSTPVVMDGLMFLTAGPRVYALSAATGKLVWKRATEPDPGTTVLGDPAEEPDLRLASWHGVAAGDGKVFVGVQNGRVMALNAKTGDVIWVRQAGPERVSEATTYCQGMLIVGMAGDWGRRALIVGLDANTGNEVWRFFITPGPGEAGHETWPQDSDVYKWGGGGVWVEAAIDPELGLAYYPTGNAVPPFGGEVRPGDNLYTTSLIALDIKTGKLRWYYQLIHHDIWQADLGTSPILYDMQLGGQTRKAIAVMRTDGYMFFLDRATGKPLLPVEERPVPQDAFAKTAPTQPFPVGGESILPDRSFWLDKIPPGFVLGFDFTPKTVAVPNLLEFRNRVIVTPMSYSPQTGYIYAQSNPGLIWSRRTDDPYFMTNQGPTTKVPGLPHFAVLAAIDSQTGKIAWKKQMRPGTLRGGGTLTTAGGLLFRLDADGNFNAYDAKTGDVLWQFQTGYAGGAGTPSTFDIDGVQHIAVPVGPAVWTFSLGGSERPLPAPTLPKDDDPFTGPIEDTRLIETMSLTRGLVLIGQKYNIDEYAFNPYRARIRAGTQVAWVNNGRETHTIQAQDGSWTTGRLIPGDMAYLTFDKPGRYTYVCKEHPWSYGQLIVTAPQAQDGLYTDSQAARGKAAYSQSCASCHGDDLSGRDPAPALSGNAFMTRWGGRSVGDLFDKTRTTMPTDKPGALSEQAYLDLVAYVFQANQLPAGRDELKSSSAALRRTVNGR